MTTDRRYTNKSKIALTNTIINWLKESGYAKIEEKKIIIAEDINPDLSENEYEDAIEISKLFQNDEILLDLYEKYMRYESALELAYKMNNEEKFTILLELLVEKNLRSCNFDELKKLELKYNCSDPINKKAYALIGEMEKIGDIKSAIKLSEFLNNKEKTEELYLKSIESKMKLGYIETAKNMLKNKDFEKAIDYFIKGEDYKSAYKLAEKTNNEKALELLKNIL